MAKITTLPQALEIIKKLRAENEALKIKAVGKRSDGTIDRYTEMEAPELRPLVIKRGGDPDVIVKGLHSRQRAIAMREWLREHPAKGEKATTPVKKVTKPSAKAPAKPAKPVRKPKAEETPARKPKRVAKPEPAPVAKKPAKKPQRSGRGM